MQRAWTRAKARDWRLAIFRLQSRGRDAFPAAERRYSFSHRLQAGGLRSRAMTSAGGAKDFCSYCRFEAADVRHETSFAATRLLWFRNVFHRLKPVAKGVSPLRGL